MTTTDPVLLADPEAVVAFMPDVEMAVVVSNCDEPWLMTVGVSHTWLTGVDGQLRPRDLDPCCYPLKVVWTSGAE